MRFQLLLHFAIFIFTALNAQDRYPYIQKPTETSVLIAWRTQSSGIGTVSYGTDATNLSNTFTEPASVTKHEVTITGLQPSTKYYYKTTTNGSSSSIEHFYTAKTQTERNMSFLLYADCGYGTGSTQQTGIRNRMQVEDVDLALVAGDVDQGTGDNYQGNYFAVYKTMLARDCHFTALGNHDIIANNGTTYLDDFYLFTNNPANSERYYSFVWGNAKFIALDSNSPYTANTAQYNWLVNELKCNDREWLFVFFHHPPWTNAWDITYYIPFQPFYQYQGNTDMRTSIVPLFEQYDVDYVMNGHAHCYQRGSKNGVNYLISGGGGAATLDAHTNSNSPNISIEKYVNQYMRFDIKGDTVTFKSIDINGNVIDTLRNIKSYTPYLANIVKTDISCFGNGNDGAASISVSGPRPPYTLHWSTGSSSANVSGLSAGVYTVTVTNGNGCQKVESVEINAPGIKQNIALAQGWNIISGFVIPDNTGMADVFQSIAPEIILVKNNDGQTYIPALSINSIGNWDFKQGYKVKTNAGTMLTLGCTEANSTTPISINAGWNIVSYLRSTEMNIETAMSSLGSDIILVKNNDGQTYIPAFNINSIGNMQPGEGYQIKMSAGGILTYPAARFSSNSGFSESMATPQHFMAQSNTGSNATIIFPQGVLDESITEGDEIAVLTDDGYLAGAVVVNAGAFALTVWGDDLFTQEVIEGMTDNDPFHFLHWNSHNGTEQILELNFTEGPGVYVTNGISIVGEQEATGLQTLTADKWLRCYPNPTTGTLYFELFLPNSSNVEINICDYAGRRVKSMTLSGLQAGKHSMRTELLGLTDGQYIFEVVSDTKVARGKIVLL